MGNYKVSLLAIALLAGVSLWYGCKKENNEEDGEGGATHNVSMDCLMCHRNGGGGDGIFTAGGTVYLTGTTIGATGAVVRLFASADGSGTPVATMTSSVGGNFYTKTPINFGTGLYVRITSSKGTSSMTNPVTTGSCNSCHDKTRMITVQ